MSPRWTAFGENRFSHPRLVRRARRWAVARVRASAPWVDPDDFAVVVSELVTNALRHSASGYSDGGVDVRLLMDGTTRTMRLVVVDDGHSKTTPRIPARHPTGETVSGHGLLLVATLARDLGYSLASAQERFCLVWAEM
ncbi:ATP-binding protein [Actinomadura atramentaria]|uniref:ATP-binding protein n=1 Tax=Actinomadura atramentaria TaxID=1990 RepID=UPI0003824F99|nr:ATP-binding protein [Actinomadura atramentaria]